MFVLHYLSHRISCYEPRASFKQFYSRRDFSDSEAICTAVAYICVFSLFFRNLKNAMKHYQDLNNIDTHYEGVNSKDIFMRTIQFLSVDRKDKLNDYTVIRLKCAKSITNLAYQINQAHFS